MVSWLQDVGLALLVIVLAWGLSRLSKWVLNWLMGRLVGRTRTQLDDAIVNAARFPLEMVILVVGVELSLAQIRSIPVGWQVDIDRAFFALYALLVFLFLYRLTGGLITWYGREVAHRTETDLDDQFLGLFRYIAQITLTIIVLIVVLGRYGIEVSALVTTLGIGSLAVALAAQETLGDMLAGFTIMVDQPFKVGDRVEILDISTWGDVVEIGLRSTRILTRDHRMVAVPNSVIGKGLVVNYSDPNSLYRVETTVGIAYGIDVEYARGVMVDAIRGQSWVIADKPVEALLLEFGDSSLNFRVRCWIESYAEARRIIDKMNTVLYYALKEANIEIPFPQREVHLVSSRTVEG